MPARPTVAVGALAGLVVVVAVAALVVLAPRTTAAAPGDPAPPALVPPAPSTTLLDNDLIPEDRDFSECVSAAPRPGCGSEARGGWRQNLVFTVVVVALGFIGWRIVRSARRRRPAPPAHPVSSAGGVP